MFISCWSDCIDRLELSIESTLGNALWPGYSSCTPGCLIGCLWFAYSLSSELYCLWLFSSFLFWRMVLINWTRSLTTLLNSSIFSKFVILILLNFWSPWLYGCSLKFTSCGLNWIYRSWSAKIIGYVVSAPPSLLFLSFSTSSSSTCVSSMAPSVLNCSSKMFLSFCRMKFYSTFAASCC